MSKIALYGISANPPTLGHHYVADIISNMHDVIDFVWVIPSYIHFFGKNMASFNDRMNMCKLAFDDLPFVSVIDYEKTIKDNNPSFNGSTFEFLYYIRAMYPDNEYYIVIGKDNADTIENWSHGIDLIKDEKFIVLPRNDENVDNDMWYMKKPHTYINCNLYNASSSDARSLLKPILSTNSKKSYLIDNIPKNISHLISTNVFEYIINNNVYKE